MVEKRPINIVKTFKPVMEQIQDVSLTKGSISGLVAPIDSNNKGFFWGEGGFQHAHWGACSFKNICTKDGSHILKTRMVP